jgi:hypothetical protein
MRRSLNNGRNDQLLSASPLPHSKHKHCPAEDNEADRRRFRNNEKSTDLATAK